MLKATPKVPAHNYDGMGSRHCGMYASTLSFDYILTGPKDIRNLIQEWAEDIDACERIWIRASGTNRKIFVDYEDSVIAKGDGRLRTFPFPTRRPVGLSS
jgi:hypothetical protein